MKSSNPYIGYLLCALMFVAGLFAMNSNQSAMFADVNHSIAEGRTLILNESTNSDSLKAVLLQGGYVEDPVDASLAASWIARTITTHGRPENLGALNRTVFKIPAEKALKEGGSFYGARIRHDYDMLGMDADWSHASAGSKSSDYGNGPSTVTVSIRNAKSIENSPIAGITVRVREHYIDSSKIENDRAKSINADGGISFKTLGYAVTDPSGQARFHLEPGRSYSFVPISRGFQYGREKGTTATGMLTEKGLTLNFVQQPHTITPLSNPTYRALKEDRTLIVRSPAEYIDSIVTGAAIYLIAWLGFFIFMIARDNRMRTRSDYMLLSVIMALTGIGLLCMYAMTNPLSDKCYGLSMAWATLYGLIAMALVSCVNPAKFYLGKSRLQGGTVPFDPIDSIMEQRRSHKSLTRSSSLSFSSGFSYLLAAVGLIILLGLFGTGPEGSDAHVNLGGFQPSEVVKYLILIFVAAFFAENAVLLQAFSAKLTPLSARRQLGTIGIVVGVMLMLMMLYLLVLSDMGPALVVLVTFIFLYSMARRDFAQLLLGLLTFIGMMLIMRAITSSSLALILTAIAWFAGWIAYGWFTAHKIYESALIVNLLIVVFALGAPILSLIGADSEAIRLANRTAMSWGGQWNNLVPGGDQVAQGIWSVASGGAAGMGLAGGSPSVVPAFHTDMAFTSIGEMTGIIGLILIILCFAVLIHRTLLIGRRAAQPFTMYLVMGIALITGVQFLFIVLGSLGIVPLTGVTVPFLSYSRTSLIATMGAFGVVIAASRMRPTESQLKYANTFSGAIAASVALFFIGSLVIIGVLANYQIINKKQTLIRPAYITNSIGQRVIEYNPRINMVLNRLHAGNIYDTNGLLLATSSPDSLRNAIPLLKGVSLSPDELKKQSHKRRRRYYTMGDQMLFMLGDAGTQKVLGYTDSDPIGFMAESRYAGKLRGIDIPARTVELNSEAYRANRFLPPMQQQFTPKEKDYTNLLPFLEYSLYNNPLIEEFNGRRESRDMYLTVDARLQKQLQDALAAYLPAALGQFDRLRASVVVLNASTGDFLTSANYPLPSQDSIVMLNESGVFGDAPFERLAGGRHKPVTERDLGMTFMTQPGSTAKVMTAMAAFKALGPSAGNIRYNISYAEEIEHAGSLTGEMSMEKAIARSSNNYFIRLLHDKNLYQPLGSIYETVGTRLSSMVDGKAYPTYFFNIDELTNSSPFNGELSRVASLGLLEYQRALNPRKGSTPEQIRRLWARNDMAMSWGQGELRASPLTMARVASIVANNGKLAPTRYVRRFGTSTEPYPTQIDVIDSQSASLLKSYMQREAERWTAIMPVTYGQSASIAGKTGTPERSDRRGNAHCNDAWYICILHSDKLNAPLAVALRLERTPGKTSAVAAEAMGKCVIPALNAAGYQIH